MRVSVLHIIEAFGAGTLTALSGICCNTGDGIRHIVAHSVRPETPEEYVDLFPAETTFRKLSMQREIRPLKDAGALLELLSTIKEVQPDVVHCHSSKSGVLGRFAAWLMRTPSVYTPHSYSFLQEGISSRQKTFYRLVEMGASRFGTAIAACGVQEYSLAKDIAGGAAQVVRIDNGVDIDALDAVQPARSGGLLPAIGMSGRYVPQRNPELFIALAEALRGKSDWVWIGAEHQRTKLPESVTATGWLSRNDTLARVAGLDIYIQTSLWEGLSYGIIEAMALGKPVVATRIPPNESVVQHGVTGFLANDKDEFLSYLTALAESPELRETKGRAGKQYIAEHHDIKGAARKYATLYRDIAAQRGAH